MLDAIVRLINLDKEYKSNQNRAGYKSIISMIEVCEGFDLLGELQHHTDIEIYDKSQKICEEYIQYDQELEIDFSPAPH